GRPGIRARPDAEPPRAPIGERLHRREVAAAAIEERIVAARDFRPGGGDPLGDLGELPLPELVVVRGAGPERGQFRLDALEHGVEATDRLAEDAYRGIEQVEHPRGERPFRTEGVDADLARLPDAVDAPDALLDGGRAPGEIVVHQHVAVLEVAALAAELAGKQDARS